MTISYIGDYGRSCIIPLGFVWEFEGEGKERF